MAKHTNLVPPVTLMERFWRSFERDPESGCWNWTGTMANTGYGFFRAKGVTFGAHRAAYLMLVGPIEPAHLHLDHLCRNTRCVNPAHLEPVTPRENQRRGFGRVAHYMSRTHCEYGHAFTPENTYIRPNGHGRECRICARIAQKRYKDKKRGAASC